MGNNKYREAESLVIDLTMSFEMPEQIGFVNGLLYNSSLSDYSRIIKITNEKIMKLRDKFVALAYLHQITDYKMAEKILDSNSFWPCINESFWPCINELPRNRFYQLGQKFLESIPEFGKYVEIIRLLAVSGDRANDVFRANNTIGKFPQGLDYCLSSFSETAVKIGSVESNNYFFWQTYRPFAKAFEKNITFPVESDENVSLFFHSESSDNSSLLNNYMKNVDKFLLKNEK